MKANMVRVQSAEVFHISEYIEDEMAARGWDRDELATRMLPVDKIDPLDKRAWGITRLALDLLMEVRTTHAILGKQADELAKAFGISAEFWHNCHNAWVERAKTDLARYAPFDLDRPASEGV